MIKIKKEGTITSYTLDIKESLLDPLDVGNFKEAFSMADSLIDSEIETLLRQIYYESKCQDLINELHYLRGRVNFDGLILAEILKSKTIINESLVNRIREFKKARNLVLHNFEGAYKLITFSEFREIKDEDYDTTVKDKATLWIHEALDIWTQLSLKLREISEKGKDYYFSHEFYKNNPRGKIVERIHPSTDKLEKKRDEERKL